MVTAHATTPDAAEAPEPAHIPRCDHLVRLAGSQWSLWKSFVLRGSGFSPSLVSALASEPAAAAGDAALEAAASVDRCRRAALEELRAAARTADAAERAALRAEMRRIAKDLDEREARTDRERMVARAVAAHRSAHDAFVAAYRDATIHLRRQLVEILSDPRFEEAALWQNHHAFPIVRRILRERTELDYRAAAFVALLVQRVAAKNETIGFFGPVCWASLTEQALVVDVAPGPDLLARRDVYFEGWCIDAIAEALNRDERVRPWTAPRLKTGVWMDDAGNVFVPILGRVPVTPEDRRVLCLCDGERTATEIASTLVGDPSPVAASSSEAFEMLRRLEEHGLVTWRLEVAPQLHPDRELQARIERIGDAPTQQACANVLRDLVAARDFVADAAGRPIKLEARLGELDSTFANCTGLSPVRRQGGMYAARALVYHDCRRACEVRLGADFLTRLGPPLAVVLDAARWVAAEYSTAARRHLRRRLAQLQARHGDSVDAHQFFEYVLSADDEVGALSADITRLYQEFWQSVVGTDGPSRVARTTAEVAGAAREAFRTDGSPWTRASYFSPDILVAAEGLDAFRHGAFTCVLGEVHATNSLLWSPLVTQHPEPRSLLDALTEDTRHLTPLVVQQSKERWTARLNVPIVPPSTWRYEFGDDLPSLPPLQSVPAARLVPVADGESVKLRTRDRALEFDALELFAQPVSREVNRIIAACLPDLPHTPRLTIGDLTVCRERWCVTPAEMGFLTERTRSSRFLALRAWARARGLPRHVFYKSPQEIKPCYLDFASAIYAEIFIRLMRRLPPTVTVRISEMLPGLNDVWLTDAAGARYTAELRIAAQPAAIR